MQYVKKINYVFVICSEILDSCHTTSSVTLHKHFCNTSKLKVLDMCNQKKETTCKLLLQKINRLKHNRLLS